MENKFCHGELMILHLKL